MLPVNTVSENQQEKMYYEMTGSQVPSRKKSLCTYPARVCWLSSLPSCYKGILHGWLGQKRDNLQRELQGWHPMLKYGKRNPLMYPR